MQICLCHVNVAIDLPGLPPIPAPVTDQSCAATSSANTIIGVGCPHAPPSCANLHSARRSRRHRLPFPAGSFIEGFRTPATVQAASLRSAGIRNPQHKQTSLLAFVALTAGSPMRKHWAINSRTRPLKKIRVCVDRLIDSRHVGWRITPGPIGHIVPKYRRHQRLIQCRLLNLDRVRQPLNRRAA